MVSIPRYVNLAVELYKRGNYNIQVNTPWGLHQKQLLALQCLNDNKITQVGYGGSARSGKSWIASEYLTMMCLAYPNTGWGLARKELKNLKRTTLLTLFKVFSKYGLSMGSDYKYNQQDQIISFSNGSQIFLIDTAYQPSDPLYTRFGGYELTGIVIDESNETDYKAIEILFGRCGFRKNIDYGIPPKMLEMFNPDKGHVYTRYYEPYKSHSERPNRRFIKALPSDNPDPAVKIWIDEQIANSSEVTIQRLVHGDFEYDESKDRLVDNMALSDLFNNEHVLRTGVKYLTADIARMGKDKTIIRLWDGWVSYKRIEIAKSKINETAAFIRQICTEEGIVMSRTIVDEDGVGGGVRDILGCHGFVANSSPVGLTNYGNKRAQVAFIMCKKINQREVYIIEENHDTKQKIKQEIDWVKQKNIDKDSKIYLISKDYIKTAIGRSPDDSDCIMMRADFELGQRI